LHSGAANARRSSSSRHASDNSLQGPQTPQHSRYPTAVPAWSPALDLTLRYRVGGYREFVPPAGLVRLAEAVWTHRTPGDLPTQAPRFHRVLPDPAMTLCFSCRRDLQGRVTAGQLTVLGPTTTPHLFWFRPGQEQVAIRLKLEWSRPLLGLDPLEHADRSDEVSGPLPALARGALPSLFASRDAREALHRLSAAVLALDDHRLPGLTLRAVELVRRARGAVTMDSVASQLGTSPRQLRRRMREEVGIGLKGYARVLRFLRAITEADRSDRPAWADLAAEAGYADQAHLVRECRALSSCTPGELFRERRAQLDEEGQNLPAAPGKAA
jgi:AraC-like DNA-binding protein